MDRRPVHHRANRHTPHTHPPPASPRPSRPLAPPLPASARNPPTTPAQSRPTAVAPALPATRTSRGRRQSAAFLRAPPAPKAPPPAHARPTLPAPVLCRTLSALFAFACAGPSRHTPVHLAHTLRSVSR